MAFAFRQTLGLSRVPFVDDASATATLAPLTPSQQERFLAEDCETTLNNAVLGSWVVLFLVPLCSVMDLAIYPELFPTFVCIRLLCALCCAPLLWLVRKPWARRNYRFFPIVLPVIPAFFISMMIFMTGEPHSGYYAGLTLSIVGASFIFNWSIREIGVTLGLIFAFYLLATLPHLKPGTDPHIIGTFMNNTLFMLMTCLILYVSSRLHHSTRIQEFLNRCVVEDQREELSYRNEELTEALDKLHMTEAQLDHNERLASIGKLSAGIIHEINNPLNYVKSALYVLNKKARKLPDNTADDVRQIASDIGEGVDRVVGIVSDLRTFSHPDNRPMQEVDLAEAMRKAERFVKPEANERGASMEVDIAQDLRFQGDESHVIQVVINVVRNALDAMAEVASPAIRLTGFQNGERILLTIHDNGHGMSGETIRHIFDPFFTTKEVGTGMGLGLSLCYRMMQEMGGDIEVESLEGEFTTFTLSFQAVAQPSTSPSLP